ncbi:RICIN domain-containing protein [Streptomyces sp. NBC_01383]
MTVTPPAQYTVFQLVNRQSGRAMDIANASTAAGTGAVQYTPSSAANQQFRFTPVGGGVYEIYTTHATTPLALGISGGGSADGAKLIQWQSLHDTNMQWKITDTGDGHVVLTCLRSGKVLGVTGGSASNGATIEQQTANGGTGQQWRRVGK